MKKSYVPHAIIRKMTAEEKKQFPDCYIAIEERGMDYGTVRISNRRVAHIHYFGEVALKNNNVVVSPDGLMKFARKLTNGCQNIGMRLF